MEWTDGGAPLLPFSGTYRGSKGTGEFFKKLLEHQEFPGFEPREFVAEGDTIVALGYLKARSKATGLLNSTKLCAQVRLCIKLSEETMNVYQEAMKGFYKNSGLQIATALGLTVLIATGLTIFVAFAFGRHHPENFLLRYLAPLLLLAGSGVSLLLGAYSENEYARFLYAFLVVLFLIGAGVSLVVTLILYAFFI